MPITEHILKISSIDLAFTREQWPEGVQLGHDAAHRPDIDGAIVSRGMKQHLGRSVPKQISSTLKLTFELPPAGEGSGSVAKAAGWHSDDQGVRIRRGIILFHQKSYMNLMLMF